jgi:hypothetical protein
MPFASLFLDIFVKHCAELLSVALRVRHDELSDRATGSHGLFSRISRLGRHRIALRLSSDRNVAVIAAHMVQSWQGESRRHGDSSVGLNHR